MIRTITANILLIVAILFAVAGFNQYQPPSPVLCLIAALAAVVGASICLYTAEEEVYDLQLDEEDMEDLAAAICMHLQSYEVPEPQDELTDEYNQVLKDYLVDPLGNNRGPKLN